jgi:hypothetical protein
MILGLSVPAFTFLHVIISLIGIAAGLIWIGGLVAGKWFPAWNGLFLITTIATSVTGFFFHSAAFGPPHIIGVISVLVLAVSIAAMLMVEEQGVWRIAYIVSAAFALYLNSFVGVVQSFQKVAPLHALAPTGGEPPFFVAQGALLILFLLLGFLALRQSSQLAPIAGQPAYKKCA